VGGEVEIERENVCVRESVSGWVGGEASSFHGESSRAEMLELCIN